MERLNNAVNLVANARREKREEGKQSATLARIIQTRESKINRLRGGSYHGSEYWYIGSIDAICAMVKKRTAECTAIGVYLMWVGCVGKG
jgi:hypothetical protein